MINTQTFRVGTIVTTDDPGRLGSIESAIMDGCNQAHRLRDRGDASELAQLATQLHRLLDEYQKSKADGHQNPAWAVPNQRALVCSALGKLEDAVEYELQALEQADTPRRIEVSAGNLADRFLRLDDNEAAVASFLEAWDAAPYSIPVMLTGARAMHRTGREHEAEQLFEALLEISESLNSTSDLAVTLRHEQELIDMAPKIAPLGRLYTWLDSLGGDA